MTRPAPVKWPSSAPPIFYSVAETARLLGTSDMTLYRAINAGEFPGVRVRGRMIVPVEAVDRLDKGTAVVPVSEPRKFLSVASAARLLRMSTMTLYRAIGAGEFPAVRIRGRLIIAARAIDEMIEAALRTGELVDAADWVRADARSAS